MTTTEDDIEIIHQFTREEAEQETAKAKRLTADLARQLLMLRTRGAHLAMQYATWTEYVEKEFGRSYRSAKYLIDFALLLKEIEERTGVTDPPLTEKGTRGATAEETETLVAAANKAIEEGADPHEAIKSAGQEVKEKRTRKARTKGDGTTGQPKKTSASEKPTGDATDTRPSIDELTADAVEAAPEYEWPAEPTVLPVKLPPFTFELWTMFTLACRDEIDAARMRADFDKLMETVDIRIHAEDDAAQRISA